MPPSPTSRPPPLLTCSFTNLEIILITPSNNDVIHLEHHATQLRSEEELLPLGDQGVDYEMLFHICVGNHKLATETHSP